MRSALRIFFAVGLLLWPVLLACLLVGCRPTTAVDPALQAAQSELSCLVAAAASRPADAPPVADPIVEAGDDGHPGSSIAEPDEPAGDVECLPDPVEVSVCPCLTGGPCGCEANGCACLCGPKPAHAVFERYGRSGLLVFVGDELADRAAQLLLVPELQQAGWTVTEVRQDVDEEAFQLCQVDQPTTFICMRRGVECGRYSGADRSQLYAMLHRANELRFPEDEP